MANLFSTSIGKKVIMSLSGFFLMSFICVHLAINLCLLCGSDTYNMAAHFMATNPIIGIIEPILGIGFLLHILYSIFLTVKNYFARPVKYKMNKPDPISTWASRNMIILGVLILTFLVIHIIDFYWKLRFGEVTEVIIDGIKMHDAYALVTGAFINLWWVDLIYIVGAIALGFHLSHGFWSAFQTIGLDNKNWKPRLIFVAKIFSILIAAGYATIPIYFLLKFNI
ncbi:succinate dehydrogenase cytochrome b subunit [Bacteroidota bacterium]